MNRRRALAELPEATDVLSVAAAVAGKGAALALQRALGGSRVYVPVAPAADTLLVQAVGLEAAVKLAAVWGGETILVPRGEKLRAAAMRREILRLLDEGRSVQAIARALGVHERTVERCGARRGDPNQPRFL